MLALSPGGLKLSLARRKSHLDNREFFRELLHRVALTDQLRAGDHELMLRLLSHGIRTRHGIARVQKVLSSNMVMDAVERSSST